MTMGLRKLKITMQFMVGSNFFLFFKRYLKSWKNRLGLYFAFTNDHCQIIRLEWAIYISSLCPSIISKLSAMNMHSFLWQENKTFRCRNYMKVLFQGWSPKWWNELKQQDWHTWPSGFVWGQSVFPGLLHRDGEVSRWESHQKTVSI